MTKQRRTFTPAFKREAACLVLDQGHNTEAVRSLGLVESALRRWVNQLQQECGGLFHSDQGSQHGSRSFRQRLW
jgi:transposase-like protein